MFKSYFKTDFRFLLKNKTFSFTNIYKFRAIKLRLPARLKFESGAITVNLYLYASLREVFSEQFNKLLY
jgi:hypothetical protein